MQLLKIFLLIGFSLFLSPLQAQDGTKVNYGIEVNLNVFNKVFEETEYAKNAYTPNGAIGGHLYLNFSQSISLKVGLNFHYLAVRQKDFNYLFGCSFDIFSNVLDINDSWRQDDYRFYSIGIPVEINWNFSDKPNGFFLNTGQEVLYQLKMNSANDFYECGSFYTSYNDRTPHTFSSFLIFAKLGLGYKFKVNEKLKLYVLSNIRYSLNSFLVEDRFLFTLSPVVNRHLLNIGITTGVSF